jgi:hypothetical protein
VVANFLPRQNAREFNGDQTVPPTVAQESDTMLRILDKK